MKAWRVLLAVAAVTGIATIVFWLVAIWGADGHQWAATACVAGLVTLLALVVALAFVLDER